MMRLAWVPLPAPGGPSSTTGPTSREVSCAIGLAKTSRSQSPRLHGRGAAQVQQPHKWKIPPTATWHPIPLPGAATANASAARRKSVIVAHDQLRLDLLDRVHGHAHYDQQRCAAEVERHTQTIGR